MIWPGTRTPTDDTVAERIDGLERIWIDTDDGRVEAWFMPGDGVSADAPGPAVIGAHGNAELIEYMAPFMLEWRRMGFSVLIPEYRGFGRSAGSPSQEAVVADFVRFHDLLVDRPEVDPERIVVMGRSLGGGVACALAAERQMMAVVLLSTFTSLRRMARGYLLPGFLVRDPFESINVLKEIAVPTLILHGRHDSMIPFSHAEDLAAAVPSATLIAYECDHNDCPPRVGRFWDDVRGFLADHSLIR